MSADSAISLIYQPVWAGLLHRIVETPPPTPKFHLSFFDISHTVCHQDPAKRIDSIAGPVTSRAGIGQAAKQQKGEKVS
ncbi:hypothetical protein [Cupriavidus sp. 8B]